MRLSWIPRVLLGTSKKYGRNIKHCVYWVVIKLDQKKGFKFNQTRSNAIILLRHASSLLYLESSCNEIWRNYIPEGFCVTSTSFEDFLWRQLDERIGFRSCWRWRKLLTNPTKNQKVVRTGRLVFGRATIRFESSGNRKRVLLDCKSTNERIGRPVFQLCVSVC